MGDPAGFLRHPRQLPPRRPVPVRLRDWKEVYEPMAPGAIEVQASRCMDCGIPFCNDGCPLGNLIPDWNDLVYRDQWRAAIERLHATNNFPEFTGRLCPAPCEAACVLGINADPVTIKQVEVSIIDRAWDEEWVKPVPPSSSSGRSVAVVGSGPAGLAAAQQLTRAGHAVTVYERADKPGGLLRYGIPEFKMEKRVLDRRLAQMKAEGTRFACGVPVGAAPAPGLSVGELPGLSVGELRAGHDAVVIATGATVPRDLAIPGRELAGIHQAMDYLPPANRYATGEWSDEQVEISAAGKRVVIIGGGDTGADCLGTAHRQGAASVHQLEIMPRPPDTRAESTPWPTWPLMFRTSSAHEEGGERLFAVNTARFVPGPDGRSVGALECHSVAVGRGPGGRPTFEPVEGSDFTLECDLVLLALGFTGPAADLPAALGVGLTDRGTVARGADGATAVEGVFVCGDAGRGQSLIVWAIAEGRACAAAVDRYLAGSTMLPVPLSFA